MPTQSSLNIPERIELSQRTLNQSQITENFMLNTARVKTKKKEPVFRESVLSPPIEDLESIQPPIRMKRKLKRIKTENLPPIISRSTPQNFDEIV